MKKVLLIAAIAFASVASAQKRTILLGGNIGLVALKIPKLLFLRERDLRTKLILLNFLQEWVISFQII
jgi:hypothetical protein